MTEAADNDISIKRVLMTPSMAKQLLGLNSNNRPISPGTIDKYAADLLANRWRFNGDAIRIDEDGVLLDGQHRLMACVKADVAFETMLIEGLPRAVFDTIDTGKMRSAAAILAISGIPNATVIASASRYATAYLRGVGLSQSIGATGLLKFAKSNPDIEKIATLVGHVKHVMPTSTLCAQLFLATRTPTFDNRAIAFVDGLATGADLKEGDPRLTLRNALLALKLKTPGKTRPNTQWQWCAITLAWNAFSTQKPLKFVRPTANKDGGYNMLNINGAPAYGAGLDALMSPKKTSMALNRSVDSIFQGQP